MPGSAARAPGTPAALLPDHEAALAGSVVTQRCSHRAHILITVGLRCLSASRRARTEPLHGRTSRGSTQTRSSPSLSFRGGRKQTKKKKKKISLSKRRRRSQNEAGQSRLRNLHFQMPSDPLSYIPREDCNKAALGQLLGQAQASGVGHSPGRGLPGWMLGRRVHGWQGRDSSVPKTLSSFFPPTDLSPNPDWRPEKGQELHLPNILFQPRQILQTLQRRFH